MPNPTLTWTATGPRAMAVAGASPTVAEMLTAAKAAIDNDSTLWQTSDYNSGNGTLEIKRKGSPTGEQSTVRILLFGGAAPHANALVSGHPAGATTSLYGGLSVDANTTGPAASYTAGAPYSTKYTRANQICAAGVIGATLPRISLIECVDGIAFVWHDTSNAAVYIAGRLIEDTATLTLYWMSAGGGSAYSNIANSSAASGATSGPFLRYANGSSGIKPSYWNSGTGTARAFGSVIAHYGASTTEPILGSNGSASSLIPLALAEGAQAATPSPFNFFAYARQMRLGPMAANQASLKDSLAVVQAIHCGPPNSAIGYGIWFDQVA